MCFLVGEVTRALELSGYFPSCSYCSSLYFAVRLSIWAVFTVIFTHLINISAGLLALFLSCGLCIVVLQGDIHIVRYLTLTVIHLVTNKNSPLAPNFLDKIFY